MGTTENGELVIVVEFNEGALENHDFHDGLELVDQFGSVEFKYPHGTKYPSPTELKITINTADVPLAAITSILYNWVRHHNERDSKNAIYDVHVYSLLSGGQKQSFAPQLDEIDEKQMLEKITDIHFSSADG